MLKKKLESDSGTEIALNLICICIFTYSSILPDIQTDRRKDGRASGKVASRVNKIPTPKETYESII